MHRQYVSPFLEKSPVNLVVHVHTKNYVSKAQRALLYANHYERYAIVMYPVLRKFRKLSILNVKIETWKHFGFQIQYTVRNYVYVK